MINFPVSVHRSTFPLMREKWMEHMPAYPTFEHAFHAIASVPGYSQFNLLMNAAYW